MLNMVLSGSTGKSTGHMVPSGPGSLCRGGGDSPYNTCIILLLDKRVGSFQSPDRLSRDLTNGLTSLSTDGVAKEGRPKFNPRPGQGLNPGTSGQLSQSLSTVPLHNTESFYLYILYIFRQSSY